MLKRCSKCNKTKPIEEFHKHKDGKYGVESFCKECRAEYYKNNKERLKVAINFWRKNNPERIRGKQKLWVENNKERLNKKRREWYKNNLEKVRVRQNKYRQDNAEKLNARQRENYKNNLEKERERSKKYNLDNRGKRNKFAQEYAKNNPDKMIERWARDREKKMLNPTRHLSGAISISICQSLKNGKNGKRCENILGYTIKNHLMPHLEKQFKDGMSWDNYGEWHVDHIIPVSCWQFNTPDDREFKQCWALYNLQPLWAKENLSKGSRIA